MKRVLKVVYGVVLGIISYSKLAHAHAITYTMSACDLPEEPTSSVSQFKEYLFEGMWHIWIGYDHILFLITLLLTATFVLKDKKWELQPSPKDTYVQVAKIVTSFTLAHSVTLGLVIFDVITLPPKLVESVIALSIAVAAVNNVFPVIHKRLWLLTMMFGLVHGMGFAGALADLGVPENAKFLTLFGFNLGVEIGQLVIVAIVLPVIYQFHHGNFYRNRIVPIASYIIVAIAMLWFFERVFEVTVLGGLVGS